MGRFKIYGSGRLPAEGNGSLLQYPCLKNPMDGGAWRATAQGVRHSLAAKQQPYILDVREGDSDLT